MSPSPPFRPSWKSTCKAMAYEELKLENQLCFPLYACAKEVVRRYKPVLDGMDLTYTQYIAMLVLWEHREISAKDLGAHLYLDSGTLTPLLKKLEQKHYVTRRRDPCDERNLLVTLTPQGLALREQALEVPPRMQACVALDPEEAQQLGTLLRKLLKAMEL